MDFLLHLPSPRHVCQVDLAELHGPGDVQVQDVHLPRTAQPHLQGDVCLSGGPLPALGRHAHPLRLQQAQHQTQGDDRLDLVRTQQLRRGGAHTLDTDEGVKGAAGLSLAQPVGVIEEGRMDGWKDIWMDGWMDGCRYGGEGRRDGN